MTLTTWLLVFGSLIAAAIVVDGLRRMFANHAALSINIDETLCGLPEEEFSSELPNGGARIISSQETPEVIDSGLVRNAVTVSKSVVASNHLIHDYVEIEPKELSIENLRDAQILEEIYSQSVVDENPVDKNVTEEPALPVQLEEVVHESQFEVAEEVMSQPLVSLDDSPVVPGNALDANDSIAKNLTDVPAFSFNEDTALTEEINLNEQEFALAASPLDLADEEACASATIDQAGIDSELDLEDTDPALDFDPTRPVHEWVETNIMVQSDLFAAQDLTSLATVKSHAPHSLVETSDDILFGDAGIEDLVFDDENLALQNQDESLSTRLAKVTSMTFGKNLLHRKRVAAKKATDLVLKHEREKQAEVVEQVISIFVTANHSQGFYGPQLLQLLQECGLVHGDMNIFHRFEDGLRLGKTQFSMANMMEPGTFDLAQMDQLHTPGVVFFLTLPTAQNNMQAFDYMLETAQCLASNLGGDILDEQRSVMRPQTIEHCRQQIREFERRHMTRRAQL